MAGFLEQLLGTGGADPRSQAMGLLAAGLLQGNAGQGLLAANQSFAEAPDRKLARDYKLMQMEEARMKMEKAKREAANEQGLASLMPQYFSAGGPAMGGTADVNAALPADLRIGAQAPIPARAPQFDVRGYTGAAMNKGYMDPLAALKLNKAFEPEVPINKLDAKDFTPESVAKFAQSRNYGDLVRLDKLHFGDTGGALVGVNPFTGEKMAGYDKTQSPDSKASNQLGWANNALTRRGQDLTDRRAGAQAEREKWSYDPTRGGLVNMQTGEFKPAMQSGQPVGTKKDEAEIKRTGAQQRVSRNLDSLAGVYDELSEMGGVIDTDRGTVPNVGNRIAASGAGQLVAGAMGTKEQSLRNRINQMRPLLLQEIRQATEMGARGLDSNKELEFYLQAATDPARDIQANKAAIQVLENAYGLSSKVGGVNPSQVGALRDEFKRVGPRSDSGKVGAEPPKIASDDDYNALPSGAEFLAPDGTRRRKP